MLHLDIFARETTCHVI